MLIKYNFLIIHVSRILENYINLIHCSIFYQFKNNMNLTETTDEIQTLFNRLKEANNKSKLLKIEINDIERKIELLTNKPIFKNYKMFLKDKICSNKSSIELQDETDNKPPEKKRKYNDDLFNYNNSGHVIVYTDGACINNGKPNAKAGIGVWFGENHSCNVSKPVIGRPTNNTAEIQACCKALEIAIDNDIKKINIRTDSEFTIKCITQWMPNWKRNNWTLKSGGEVKNKEDLVKLDHLVKKFITVKWEHVNGHQGIIGNEMADNLARLGAEQYKIK